MNASTTSMLRIITDPVKNAPILDALPAHVAVLDSRGVIVAVNQAWEGFAKKNALQGSNFGIGQNYIKLCERAVGECSDEAREAAAGINRVLQGEAGGYSIDYPCHSPREQRWFRMIVAPLAEQPLAGVVVMHLNITESKKGELAALRLAEIVESSDDAIIGKDLNSIITSWNKGAERIFGYTASEMVGNSIMSLIPEYRRDEEEIILEKIRHGKSVEHFETLRQTKSGSLIHVSVTASPIRDTSGKVIGVSKVAHDITRRKRSEDSLRLFRTLLDQSNDSIEVVDAQTGRFLDVNETTCRRLGYTREEMLALTLPEVVDHEGTLLSVEDTVKATRKCGSRTVESRHRRKDGSTFPVEVNVQYIDLRQGYLVAVVRDISERKLAEEKVNNQLDELRRWQSVTIGRETRICELKAEVNEELAARGLPPRYANPSS